MYKKYIRDDVDYGMYVGHNTKHHPLKMLRNWDQSI